MTDPLQPPQSSATPPTRRRWPCHSPTSRSPPTPRPVPAGHPELHRQPRGRRRRTDLGTAQPRRAPARVPTRPPTGADLYRWLSSGGTDPAIDPALGLRRAPGGQPAAAGGLRPLFGRSTGRRGGLDARDVPPSARPAAGGADSGVGVRLERRAGRNPRVRSRTEPAMRGQPLVRSAHIGQRGPCPGRQRRVGGGRATAGYGGLVGIATLILVGIGPTTASRHSYGPDSRLDHRFRAVRSPNRQLSTWTRLGWGGPGSTRFAPTRTGPPRWR